MIAAAITLALLAQADGGTTGGTVYPALRLTLELPDGGVVMLGPLADGGIAAAVFDLPKLEELAQERVRKDAELAELRKMPPPPPQATNAAWLGVVGTFLTNALQVVPIIIEATRRQP